MYVTKGESPELHARSNSELGNFRVVRCMHEYTAMREDIVIHINSANLNWLLGAEAAHSILQAYNPRPLPPPEAAVTTRATQPRLDTGFTPAGAAFGESPGRASARSELESQLVPLFAAAGRGALFELRLYWPALWWIVARFALPRD